MKSSRNKKQRDYFSGRYIGDIRFILEYYTEEALIEYDLISDSDREDLSPLAGGYILCESKNTGSKGLSAAEILNDPPLKEALVKRECRDKTFYLLAERDDDGIWVECCDMNESQFEEKVRLMEEEYPFLKSELSNETDSQKRRRRKNTAYVHSLGVSTLGNLPANDDSQCFLKDKETVCRRAMASILMAELAVGFLYEEREYFENDVLPSVRGALEYFGVEEDLNHEEESFLEAPTEQKAKDISWKSESYWALCWCLGLIDDMKDACSECDLDEGLKLLADCDTAEGFTGKCRLRDKSEIIDMEDLYLRYHWATHNGRLGKEGYRLNPSVVVKRRRGLEWVLSDVADWNSGEIDMNT